FIVKLGIPNQLTIPGEFLNTAAGARPREECLVVTKLAGSQQMAVFEKVRVLAGGVFALPGADYSALHVDQVRVFGLQRKHQGIPSITARLIDRYAYSRRGALLFG